MAARRTRPFRFAFLAVSVVALVVAASPGLSHRPAEAKEPLAVYASIYDMGLDGPTLTALDARTLADLADRPIIDLDDGQWIYDVSADGLTFVVGGHGEIEIRAGLDGPEWMTFRPEGRSPATGISRNGLRVVAASYTTDKFGHLYPEMWRVFDTITGDLIATVENGEGRNAYGDYVVDADATRLYRLVFPKDESYVVDGSGTRSGVLIAYDLTTGTEISRLDLPGVVSSGWQTDTPATEALKELKPALAISPDDQQIVIAHANEDAITIVDTQRLAVERTLAVTQPRSRLQRLLGWTGLIPQSASAKTAAGTLLHGVLSPDGEHLYLYGAAWGEDANGERQQYHGIGLRIIDLDSGEIKAEVLDGDEISQLVPSPDGRTVYVTGIKRADHTHTAIWRINRETGDIGAERLLPGGRGMLEIFLLPVQ